MEDRISKGNAFPLEEMKSVHEEMSRIEYGDTLDLVFTITENVAGLVRLVLSLSSDNTVAASAVMLMLIVTGKARTN